MMIRSAYHFFFGSKTARVKAYLRIMNWFQLLGYWKLSRLIMFRLERKHSVLISNFAQVPSSVQFVHPIGIVVGRGVKLGENVKIFQNVTLGGREIGSTDRDEFPSVGDNTVIFAGAVIIGNVRIGRNCVVGANAVVTTDLPDNSTAVGAPARVVSVHTERLKEV